MKKVLLLCLDYTPYLIQLWDNLKKYYNDLSLNVLTKDEHVERYKRELDRNPDEKVYSIVLEPFPIRAFKVINGLPEFDIIQALWMEKIWGFFARSLRKKARLLYVEVGGSDLYRWAQKTRVRMLQKRLIKRSDVISSENEQTRECFYRTYGQWTRDIPHSIVRFGVDVIDEISIVPNNALSSLHTKWNVPYDKCVVMLGYNGHEQQQHFGMISSIEKIKRDILDNLFFVIPMTYGVGNKEYRVEVEKRIKEITDGYIILDEFLDKTQMAEITVITDIMIHVQTTDQLSSTMMAHIYNGNVVIAGSWLPYECIKREGIKIWEVDSVAELTECLSEVALNLDKCKAECEYNRNSTYKFSSWEYCIKDWRRIYDGKY